MQITLVKSVAKNVYLLGETITYCLLFTNIGSSPATFNIWDTIPAVTTYAGCDNGTKGYASGCAKSGNLVIWNVTAPAGGFDTVCFYTKVTSLPFFMINREFLALMEDEKYLACAGGLLSDRKSSGYGRGNIQKNQ
jgi:uncharacterized repeat protein (TIGR01451 family)